MGERTTTLVIVTGICASAALLGGCVAPGSGTSPAAAELAATVEP